MDINKDFLKEIGKKIIEIREKKGDKQSDLSFHTGLEVSEISKYEQGKINMTFKTFLKFAHVLDVHPKELLDFEFDIKKHTIK
ncbi:helix-turn-helix domain-containing protein [Salegentibacter sp. LM13S]|uniref:helix-turn-helix domain-containing protein n=1 Tax=Salegentibacter lacus TaxID=2873599 RepID=UPI001CCBF420|nr:helix-turn-helix transcriptional regulator [Salegentibacter lacus]MBZ9629798.1 helix-turn-helix domain-containing protein [Salegentibacter lacus]